VDFSIYEAVNDWAPRHAGVVHALDVLETALVVAIAAAAVLAWLAARPGGPRRWKLASASALASGALGYALDQLVHAGWDRARPYDSHAGIWHPFAHSHDASFPSDHASAAFGIAWAVFLYDRAVGAAFLAVAFVLSWLRVVLGFHYPADVGAGALVGLVAALLVVRAGRPAIAFLVARVERLTDPLAGVLHRLLPGL